MNGLNNFTVDYATTTNLTVISNNLSLTATSDGVLTIDDTLVIIGNIILVKDQTDQTQNGVYDVIDTGSISSPFKLKRNQDALYLQNNSVIFVNSGSANINTSWVFRATDNPLTLEVSNITFEDIKPLDNYFMAYSTSLAVLIAGFTPIPWNIEKRKDLAYTHTVNSANISVNSDGDYQIISDIGIGQIFSNVRSSVVARLVKNSIEIAGTRVTMYTRNQAEGVTSGTISWIESLVTNDVIAVEVFRISGTGGTVSVPSQCRITMKKL